MFGNILKMKKGYNISTVAPRGGTSCNGMLFLYVLKPQNQSVTSVGVKFKYSHV